MSPAQWRAGVNSTDAGDLPTNRSPDTVIVRRRPGEAGASAGSTRRCLGRLLGDHRPSTPEFGNPQVTSLTPTPTGIATTPQLAMDNTSTQRTTGCGAAPCRPGMTSTQVQGMANPRTPATQPRTTAQCRLAGFHPRRCPGAGGGGCPNRRIAAPMTPTHAARGCRLARPACLRLLPAGAGPLLTRSPGVR
jgi:hypothetical protein